MKRILAISNSFGEDANRYLYGIARCAGEDVKVVTLYIGGCSLYRHYRNMLSGEKAYEFILNGIRSGLQVSLREALLSDEWDIVTLQECSPRSATAETYFPYITELAAYVRRLAPECRLYLHETWSFAAGCSRFDKTPCRTREEMIPRIRRAYSQAAEAIGADGRIPSLEVMNRLYDAIGDRAYRDGFHASYGVGRYALGCLWCAFLLGVDVAGNTFRDLDVPVAEEEIALAQGIVTNVIKEAQT